LSNLDLYRTISAALDSCPQASMICMT